MANTMNEYLENSLKDVNVNEGMSKEERISKNLWKDTQTIEKMIRQMDKSIKKIAPGGYDSAPNIAGGAHRTDSFRTFVSQVELEINKLRNQLFQ